MNRDHPPRGGMKSSRIQRHISVYQKTAYEEGYMDYNIWYHRHFGRKKDELESKPKAEARCNVKEDSGWTKGWEKDDGFICIFFAKGICSFGENCEYIHFPPTTRHERNQTQTYDCFGRERFGTDREDMGGVGNFNRSCKLLQVAGLAPYSDKKIEEVLFRHFMEWGRLEYVRVVNETTALIKYQMRGSAEFAKEAMNSQSLDAGEVLDITWAKEDPREAEIEELKTKILAQHPGAFSHAPAYSERQVQELMAAAVVAGLVAPYPATDDQYPQALDADSYAQTEDPIPAPAQDPSDVDEEPKTEESASVCPPPKKKFRIVSKTEGEVRIKSASAPKPAPQAKRKKADDLGYDLAAATEGL
eukprot:TRINITY_DN5683_c0_g1_i1.p1 TRINITY_DN5683_c0_g1~~TRINITY_DN5683_c0_g1_i1.p1  ORF type:complete len:368 (-),score=69.66 TRINITY_DN5683_c0_g1_i1:30-1109(-)